MQTNTELVKVFQEHKHNLDLLVGPSEGLLAALPSLNIIDSKLTAPCDFPNLDIVKCWKHLAPCESTTKEVWFEWSHHKILSADSKVRITTQDSIIHNTFTPTFNFGHLEENSIFWVCEQNSMMWPFKWNLFSSTFIWSSLFSIFYKGYYYYYYYYFCITFAFVLYKEWKGLGWVYSGILGYSWLGMGGRVTQHERE